MMLIMMMITMMLVICFPQPVEMEKSVAQADDQDDSEYQAYDDDADDDDDSECQAYDDDWKWLEMIRNDWK